MVRISEKQFKEIQKRMQDHSQKSNKKSLDIRKTKKSRLPIKQGRGDDSPIFKVFFPIAPQSKERARTFVADLSGRDAWAQVYSSPGRPATKPVMRTVTKTKTRTYEKFVSDIALSSMLSAKLAPFRGAIMKYTIFRISGDPKEWPTSIHDGDIDNLEKALSDGMNKIAYEDDRLIVGNSHIKICSHAPGIAVLLREAVQEDIIFLENILGGRGGI